VQLDEDLQKARCIVVDGDASSYLPGHAQGKFLRMFLGPINVRASRKDIQLKVKEEYNSYRVLFTHFIHIAVACSFSLNFKITVIRF
jgi:hypothetical protein